MPTLKILTYVLVCYGFSGLQFNKNDGIINKQRLHKICDEAGGCCSVRQVISAEYVRVQEPGEKSILRL